MQPRHWTAFIVLGGIWSASFLWIKIALDEIDPNTLVAWRVLFGLLFAGGAVFLQRKAWPRGWGEWLPFIVLGVTSIAIPFFLITWGELSIDSAVASILNATVPLFTIVIAHLFLHDDKMTVQRVVGLFVGFIGVIVLLNEDLTAGAHGSILGQAAVIVASIFYAASSVYALRCKVVFLADRGFADTSLMEYLSQTLHWHWWIRIKSSFVVYRRHQRRCKISSIALKRGQARFWHNVYITDKRFSAVHLVLAKLHGRKKTG